MIMVDRHISRCIDWRQLVLCGSHLVMLAEACDALEERLKAGEDFNDAVHDLIKTYALIIEARLLFPFWQMDRCVFLIFQFFQSILYGGSNPSPDDGEDDRTV